MISPKLYSLEREIASLLLDKLEKDEITLERAAQISRYVLQALPDNLTDQQINGILPNLDDQFIELASIVNQHLKVQKIAEQNTVDEATRLIHQGKLEEAIRLMNNHIKQN